MQSMQLIIGNFHLFDSMRFDCIFKGGWYQLNRFASEWTNSSLIAFDAQISTTIEQFDHFVNLPKGYTFWTQAYYDQSAQLWMWSANYPVDTSLFCNNTVPPAKRKKCAIPNGVFYDGSGCLKSGRRDVKRYPLLVGFDYTFFSGSSSSSSEI